MFARTERLLLRPGWADDAAALSRAIGEKDIVRNLATAPWPYALGDARRFLEMPRGEREAVFLIFARTDGAPKLVGGCGIHDDEAGEPEIGYWIARKHWGKGFATEAGRALVEIARHTLRLPSLVAGHFTDNPASGRVLRKLGFRPTGRVAPRFSKARGLEAPSVLMALEFDADLMDSRTLLAA